MFPAFEELYTPGYVQAQLRKFRDRHVNHWRHHLRLARALAAAHLPPPPGTVLDLGCSIGTFALEFAAMGYETAGLDLDEKALEAGKALALEMNVPVRWICADAANFTLPEPVDAIICFDLLEHLEDEALAGLFACVRRAIRPGGVFLFHTFPMEHDHIFYRGNLTCLPLAPLSGLPPRAFEAATRGYARLLDAWYRLRHGKTHKQRIAATVHPNPLSRKRLDAMLWASGLEVLALEATLDGVNPLKPGQGWLAKRLFAHQEAARRSLYGAARKPSAGYGFDETSGSTGPASPVSRNRGS